MNIANESHLQLPPERFFWALLNVESLPRSRRQDMTALGYLFETVLPVPLEQVHASYAPCAINGGMQFRVACGLPRDELVALASQHPTATSLVPQSLPAFLSERVADFDCTRLNLLTDRFEPKPLRRMQGRLVAQTVLAIALITGVIIAGQFRRTAHLRKLTAEVQAKRIESIEAVIGPTAPMSTQPPDLRMLAELRTLEQTRGRTSDRADGPDLNKRDILGSYVELATDWPRGLPVRADSVVITHTSMTIRGVAPSSGIVQSLADALSGLEGWRLEQPQISASNAGDVQMTLQWRHDDQSGPSGGPS